MIQDYPPDSFLMWADRVPLKKEDKFIILISQVG
jgi:hypothetical protein